MLGARGALAVLVAGAVVVAIAHRPSDVSAAGELTRLQIQEVVRHSNPRGRAVELRKEGPAPYGKTSEYRDDATGDTYLVDEGRDAVIGYYSVELDRPSVAAAAAPSED